MSDTDTRLLLIKERLKSVLGSTPPRGKPSLWVKLAD